MKNFACLTVLAFAGSVALARAQTPPTPMQPPAAAPMAMPPMAMPAGSSCMPVAKPAAIPGDMGAMTEKMRPMMGAGGMAMPFEHVEGRIAYLKAELKITEAQAAPWDAYAASLRADAASMKEMHDGMAKDGMATSLPLRLASQQEMMSTHLASVERMGTAAKPLYAALSEDQKKLLDQMTADPMGMM